HDWDKAVAEWQAIEMHAKGHRNPKAAGRAAYNIAVAAEMQGKVDVAIEWAKLAWQDYGNKKARDYIQVLQQRQSEDERAADQMNKKV
ncbi:MAG TPA: DUF6340 family protein, partial [Saprospiraceae bacterium]|nr:DUF6340 family protein [Saprospiraceae bacterium]